MEKYLEHSKEVVNQLKEKYKACDFYFRLKQSNVNISVFFILANSAILSEENLWENVSKEIALKYQSKLETVYEKWNLYIIYITSDIILKELKNRIENNKFSSRKIVEDAYDKEFNNEESNRLIVKHITNADLKEIVETTKGTSISVYEPENKKLWELLAKDEKVSGDRKAQEEFIKQIDAL